MQDLGGHTAAEREELRSLQSRVAVLEERCYAQEHMITAEAASDTDLIRATRRARYQEALARCSQLLMTPAFAVDERIKLLARALEQLRGAAGATRAAIWRNTIGPDLGESLSLVVDAQTHGASDMTAMEIPWSEIPPAISDALSERQPFGGPTTEIYADRPPLRDQMLAAGIATSQLLPIHIDQRWWGLVGYHDASQRIWDDIDVTVLQTAAELFSQVLRRWEAEDMLRANEEDYRALALEHARLYEEAQHRADRELRARERLNILQQSVREVVAQSTSLPNLYRAIHSAVASLMPADAFVITLFDQVRPEIEYIYMADESGVSEAERAPLPGSFGEYMLRRRAPLHVRNFDEFHEHEFQTFGTPNVTLSGLAILIQGRSGQLGTLFTQSYKPNSYTDEDVAILELLAAHVATAIETAQLFAEVERLATIDPLTELINRRELFRRMHQEVARAQRTKRPLALLMLDIDHFKQVNDTYGHQMGDHVLTTVAGLCRTGLRTSDVAGRYGGEEIVILLPEIGHDGALRVAERMRTSIEALSVVVGGVTIQVTSSVGVAVTGPEKEYQIERLLSEADQALYLAKQQGRNCVVPWKDPEP